MASESTEDRTVTLALPADLDDWLDERARELDLDRETVLVQLVASYRATEQLDAADELDDQHPRPETRAGVVTPDQLSEARSALRADLEQRIDALEDEYTENLEDVRKRVIQVKQEADGKAPADHSHEALARVDELADRLAAVEATLKRSDISIAEQDVAVEEMDDRLETVEDRLKTLAWTVKDLRTDQRTADSELADDDVVDHIKRTAAQRDIDRAKCENCNTGVDIALLTDPECPHCQATVTDVEPGSGFFSKPQLLVASQLESGDRT